MAEFPDENGRFSCLEEMEEDIYIVEGDDEPQQETSSTYPPSTYHHIFLITGGVTYQHGWYLFMKFFLYF